jgi:hypothetical protein
MAYDSISKAAGDNNIPEPLLSSFAGDVYDAIAKKEAAEKRTLSNFEIESTIRDVMQKKSNIYLSPNYGWNIPSDVDQYVKDKYFKSPDKLRNYLEFKEAYLSYVAMLGLLVEIQ